MGIIRNLLSLFSGGTGEVKVSEQLLFDKVIGFKGIIDGAGASTIVQNVAVALADTTRYKICVVDTNMLYPCQFDLLGCSGDTKEDILDYSRGVKIGNIVNETKYGSVYHVGFRDRTVIDLVAVTESLDTFDKLLNELKMYYDIILVDLSHEQSNFATEAAIKCNKIFMICDESIKSTSNLVHSYNYITTLGVSLSKCKRIILNKTTTINTGIRTTISDLKLEIFGEIPFSEVIYKQGVSGAPFYGIATRDANITEAHVLISKLVKDIIEETPTNSKNIIKGKQNKDDISSQEIDFDMEIQEEEKPQIKYSEHDIMGNGEIEPPPYFEEEPTFSGGED